MSVCKLFTQRSRCSAASCAAYPLAAAFNMKYGPCNVSRHAANVDNIYKRLSFYHVDLQASLAVTRKQ
ncbi:hypothetical protein JOB18_045085 [Solea senegalensis]|uniref:Uncharacterized protein n=1 Tax=Solea senegalensis TaxID=28829 RepID=A0AAV6R2Q2_SOLSE|nr:hypothetical protein JOB18_045085 [Solea senegalensis]